MKISFQNNVVGLSAESPEERAICALLAGADGYVFQLHAVNDRGLAFSMIGPEDDARRAPLNIVQSIAPRFAPISNLAHTPFELDGQRYASIEGFWQGLKRLDPAERRSMAQLWGSEAKGQGNDVDQPISFDYEGVTITAGSPEGGSGSESELRRYVPGPGGEPLVQIDFNAGVLRSRKWFYADRLGSIVAMADSAGNSTEQ